MNHQEKGRIGYHELSKLLISEGYTVNNPDIDKGIDLFAIKNEKVYFIQIKTVILSEDDKFKTITASGSMNGLLSERYSGKNLVVLCLNNELERNYTLTFAKENLPFVQSLKITRNKKDLGKYERFTDNIEALSSS